MSSNCFPPTNVPVFLTSGKTTFPVKRSTDCTPVNYISPGKPHTLHCMLYWSTSIQPGTVRSSQLRKKPLQCSEAWNAKCSFIRWRVHLCKGVQQTLQRCYKEFVAVMCDNSTSAIVRYCSSGSSSAAQCLKTEIVHCTMRKRSSLHQGSSTAHSGTLHQSLHLFPYYFCFEVVQTL